MQKKRTIFNIVILGDTNIGKTWILNSYKGIENFEYSNSIWIDSSLVKKNF